MRFAITPIVQRLLIINVVVFALTYLLGNIIDLNRWLALHSFYSGDFVPFQFLTYMFMHGDIMHIFSNMFGLYVFGPMLEHFLGAKKFLVLYFVCGIGAGFLYWGINAYEVHQVQEAAVEYIANPTPEAFTDFLYRNAPDIYKGNLNYVDNFAEHPHDIGIISETKKFAEGIVLSQSAFTMVGASGAIFGILMAFALLFPNTEMMLLFPPIPIKAKYLVGAYALYEIYAQFQNRPGDNVAHFAHITGMIFAFILIRYWKTNRNSFY
jgi:membrane associated rhomboid family serine protease